MTATHAVVVLAAGGSTRLGQPKQLLTRQGETLVRRVVRLALEFAPSQVLVVVGANAQAVTSSIAGLEATPVTICRRCFPVPEPRRQGARVPVMETRLAFLQ